MINKQFLYYSTKDEFLTDAGYKETPEQDLNLEIYGNIYGKSIAYIADTKEIWTHGVFYTCALDEDKLNELIEAKGYITLEDIPSIPTAGTMDPKVAETAVVGTSTNYAREDHVHPAQTSVSGNAGTATKLQTERTINLTGDVTGAENFDGSKNIFITTAIENIDASKITSGTLNADRLPEIPISKIPAAAMERLYVVESQSAAMSLTIQEGDVVQIGSGGPMYFCVSESASTFATKFKEFTAGSATSVPWSGVTGKPTFATVATSGSYNDLTNKPTIPSLSGYATQN